MCTRQVQFMMENGLVVSEMVSAPCNGWMEHVMLESGSITKLMEEANFSMLKEMSMMASGLMTKRMVLVSTGM